MTGAQPGGLLEVWGRTAPNHRNHTAQDWIATMVPNSVGPRYLYGTDTAEAFADQFAPRKSDALPLYIHDIGTEGLRFPINPARLISVQHISIPAGRVSVALGKDVQTIGPANRRILLRVTVAEDTMTGHPGFDVAISLPYDASVAYTYPEDAI